MKKEIYIEQKEKELFEADLRADFIRHGKPEYTEEEVKSGKFEGALKKESIEETGLSASELAEGIDKNKEIVVIWVSPKRRAQQSAEIYKDILEKQGIDVLAVGRERKGPKLRTKEALRDTEMTGEFVKEIMEKNLAADWMEYWVKAEELPKEVEKPEEVKRRVTRIMTYLERIARTIQPEKGRKLHFLCFGHEELVRDLLEEAYKIGTKRGEGPTYGERMRIDVYKSSPEKDAVFDVDYRDKKTELGFRKEDRSFYRKSQP